MVTDAGLTGVERTFDRNEIIVTKTDLKGRITYGNEVFLRLAGYGEREVLGRPHNIIRHPGMPRCVFKLLWDTIETDQEIFAYVVNRARNGDHYWVFAHVTPSFDAEGKRVGYHSNRRVPDRRVLEQVITPLYDALLERENQFADPKEAMAASTEMLTGVLKEKGMSYAKLVFSL